MSPRQSPEDPAQRAYPVQALGRAHLVLGNWMLAIPLFDDAMKTLRNSHTGAALADRTARNLAHCLQALKIQPSRVRALIVEARVYEASIGDPDRR